MPRLKSTLPGGHRISDLVTLGVLAEYVPSDAVHAAVREAGVQGVRDRLLPADLTALYVVAMNLYRDVSYEEVLSCVMEGLRWLGLPGYAIATKGAISQARERLGKDAMRMLFERLCKPLAAPGSPGSYYRSWLTVALDGTVLSVPDSKANADEFGYASMPGQSSYPLLRCACLCETGTHAAFAAAIGPYRSSEKELAQKLAPSLKPGMLLLADRGYLALDLWEECLAGGAELLWRATRSWKLKRIQELEDGSWISQIHPSRGKTGKARLVRVLQYEVEGSQETYRLVTSILDPAQAPALELALLYAQRWEIELAFDEMKTHLKGARVLLRSRTPEMVEQEFWGLMIAHRALRALMSEAALERNKDPDEISFVGAVRIVKRTLPSRAGFPPLQD